MKPSCWRIGRLLERRAGGLNPAERLLIEQHLGDCPRCAAEAALLLRLGEVIQAHDFTLGRRSRERAVARALRAPAQAPPQTSAGRRYVLTAALAAAALLFVAALRWWSAPWPRAPVTVASALPPLPPIEIDGGSARTSQATLQNPPGALAIEERPSAPSGVRLLTGEARAEGAPLMPGDSAGPGQRVEASKGARLGAGAAVAEVVAPAALRFTEEQATLALLSGSLVVEVTPPAGELYRVVTERFTVEVIGTRFEVSVQAVRVVRGRVRVIGGGGEVVADLKDGEAWSAPEPAQASAVSPTAFPTVLLQNARRELARGRVDRARQLIRGALGASLDPAQRAEAESLLAECALVAGDPGGAARAYADVAEKHPGTLTAESSLFAAARAERRAGRPAAARALLERYLRTYPQGRFRQEALAQLRELGGGP